MTAIVCDVCPRACRLEEGKTAGFCRVRANINGENRDRLYRKIYIRPETDGYGSCIVLTPGCNLGCPFCGAPYVSRPTAQTPLMEVSEAELVNRAIEIRCKVLWFESAECSLHWEWVSEVARLCRENGILTALPLHPPPTYGRMRADREGVLCTLREIPVLSAAKP